MGPGRWSNHPDSLLQIEKLNKRVNTGYSEFGALQSGDTIYYSSYRYENKKDKNVPPRKYTKVLTSVRGSKGRPLRRNFNVDTMHTAHTAFSLDRKRIYFTKCRYVNGTEIRCAIYYREKDKRRRWKTKAVKLPETINWKDATATQPSIGFDSILNSEVLFYASDRPGGEGGMDLWQVKVLEGDNKFSNPVRLDAANTAGDDITPFFHSPSQKLYFSSDALQGLGGYDIYRIDRTAAWGSPEHLGVPMNTSYNDVYYFLNPDEKTGYLSSNRPGSYYLDSDNKACCNDIYRFQWLEPQPPVVDSTLLADNPPTELPPVVATPPVEEEFVPTKLEDFLPLALYFDNDEPDKRTRRTSTKKSYETTYLRYYDRKGEYQREYARPLSEDDVAEAELLIDDFFEQKVKKGYDFLFRFSEILLQRLEAGEEVEIFIKGFTSPRAKSDYNLALSKRRISSLRNHFDT